MNTVAKRILFWVIFVGLVGGLLECKAAVIEFQKVLKGFITGGGVGFFIAMMLNIFSGHKKQKKPDNSRPA
jgi:hypothetical protein